uniref:Phlebovirus glycoprotein G2 fusion domain-containing protein n=1 Tax=Panagrolaimus sp. ES5 TaxID=591445 RepID=A0AC34GHF8_9BILA
MAKLIKSLIFKCIRFCLKGVTRSQRHNNEDIPPESPPPARHNPFLYVPRPTETVINLGIIMCLIGAVTACSDVVSLSAIQESCLMESTGLSCTFNQQTLLSLSPHGQTSCLLLKNNRDENIGMVTLNVAKVAAYCKPHTLYFTREYIIKSKSSKRCRSAGSCHDSNCEETDLQTKISELNGEANDSPGYTYCAASCGCITCSCFYCSPGCLFWRTYAIPKSEKIYEVFSCSSWEQRIKMDMVVKV